jgi:mannan endo-1,4-beta-mannosidase
MKSTFSKLAALLLLLLPLSTSHLFALSGFVTRQGTNFMLSGQPFFFAGANCYDLFTYGDGSSAGSSNAIETLYMSKSEIDAQMARMQGDGVTVVRTWGFNHQVWHGFETNKGVYNEPEFREFDYILNSASNHNIRLIVALENYWAAYGGIATRLQWAGLSGSDPGMFFTNKPAIQGYTNYVKYFLNRTNHYTGIQYKNDPTIFAWEVMNEPRDQDDTSGNTMRAWMDSVGACIKAVDTNHLLGTGMEGQETAYGYGGDVGAPFVLVQQSTNIDFCSAHVYPTESWANLSIAATTNLIINHWAHDANVLVGKPFFLGEFNVMNGSSMGTRSNYWTAIYQTIQAQNIGGSAFWWYEEANIDGEYGVQQGAPELAVFRAHSEVMQAKSGGGSTLGSFGAGLAGYYPNGLARGADGRLYGTTQDGGANDLGTVFVADTNGQPVDLYSFTGAGDGAYSYAALIQGADGNFYGTTPGDLGANGDGTVFSMTTNGAVSGIYSFTGGSDGASPYAPLVQTTDGSLFGVTYYGGAYGYGTVFKVSTNGVFNLLHAFTGGADGAYSDAALVQGADGNLYGAASGGGAYGDGTVFTLAADGTFTTLYSFTGGNDGYSPDAALVQGNDGNFYGVTSYGGANLNGTIFRITTSGVLTTLHAFAGGSDGATPYGGLRQLADGNLYGTTAYGGPYNDGTVFRITPGGTVTILAWFDGYNGANPQSALVQGSDGALYGTTLNGGVNSNGVIFRVTVPVPPVGSVTTTLGLATSGSPSAYGNPVTFTATIRTNGVAVGNISGEAVTFYDGTVSLGIGTLNGSGQAAYLTGASQLSAATHSVTAVYGGDATYAGSTNSPALSQTVNQATLTAGLTGTVSKNYNGTTTATLAPANYTLSGVVSGDSVTLNNPASGTYDTRNAGTGKTVTVTGLAISGSSAPNYILSSTTANGPVGTINKASLTVTAAANVKPYNGTIAASATPTITSGSVQTGDTASFTETYDTANTGTGKTLTPSGSVNDGNGGNNYAYTFVASANGTINPATLTYTANAASMTYGSSVPALSGTVGGFISGENQGDATTGTLSFTTPATPSSNVGTYAINGSGLTANNGNYNFVQAPTNATALTIQPLTAGLGGSRAYDATTTAAAAILSVTNKIGSDDVSVASGSGTLAGAGIGAQAITSLGDLALGGVSAPNYTLSGAGGSVTITAANLTVSGVTAANKVYDGTTAATLLGAPALVGVVSNEDVSLSTGTVTASFADPAVGFGKPVAVSGYLLVGTAVGNYTLTQPTLTADILPSTAPVFVGQGISKDSGGWKLKFSGPAGQTYTVLTASDLTQPINQWTTLTTGTFGSGAVLFIDGSNTQPARFYLISP